jgi:photosystem II stability/assembly factor-like uncharacterized protein
MRHNALMNEQQPARARRMTIRRHRMRIACLAVFLLASFVAQTQGTWTMQQSGVTARLRGVSAASADVVWASGSAGTVLRSGDRGATWTRLAVPGAEELDFRDVDAVDERTAFVLSIGPGDASRIYRTGDGGATWTLQFRNNDPQAFYDAMAFRDPRQGYAFSDSVDGAFVVLRTDDGGANWNRIPPDRLPAALPGEGAYAASGSNIAVMDDHVWIGTSASRVLRSGDGGRTWSVAPTPVPAGPSAGIFSVAFSDASHGIVVGGDYKLESAAKDNAAITEDGGRTWTVVSGLSGFRSAAAFVPGSPRTVIAVGPSGADISTDGGRSWRPLPGPGFHAVAFAPRIPIAWAVGENGAIGRSLH